MISAWLLPLFFVGTPAHGGGASSGDPPIRIEINHDGRFLPGDDAKVQVRTREDGYLLVLQADLDGQLRVLFPLDPDDDNFVPGGKRYDVKGSGGREAFRVEGTSGRGMVYAAVSRSPFRFDDYRLGGHWDYRALAPSRLPGEPESELTELVRRLAQGDFDYDVATYDVTERVAYAPDYWYRPGNFAVSAGFFFGRPFFFDPFFPRAFVFDPFFDPFFPRAFFFDPFFDPFARHRFFFGPFVRRPFLPLVPGGFFRQPFLLRSRGLASVPFRYRTALRRSVTAADVTPGRARAAGTASRGRRVMAFRPPAFEARPIARRALDDRMTDERPVMDPAGLPGGHRVWRTEGRPGLELTAGRGGMSGFARFGRRR